MNVVTTILVNFLEIICIVNEECFHNHVFVFIAIYRKSFDYISILNSFTLTNDCLYIKRKKIKLNDKTKWIP